MSHLNKSFKVFFLKIKRNIKKRQTDKSNKKHPSTNESDSNALGLFFYR